jgi:hypothetical protein
VGLWRINVISRAIVGSVATLVLAFPVPVRAQAAAESAMTKALSSPATLKGGSALNRALNQSSSRLGTRIQDRTSTPARVGTKQPRALKMELLRGPNPASRAAVGAGANSSPSRSGISIRGGESNCTSVGPSPQASPAPGSSGTMSGDCRDKKSDLGAATTDKYKPFVTLSFPK